MTTALPDEHYCTFDPMFHTNSIYVCYNNEICCPTGCCPSQSFKYVHSWYFWVAITLFIILFYGLAEYCKRMEKARLRRLRNRISPNRRNLREARTEEYHVDNFLERLLETYSTRFDHQAELGLSRPHTEPPPKYSDALFMPKPLKKSANDGTLAQVHQSSLQRCHYARRCSSNTDVLNNVPTYDEAVHFERNNK